MRDKNSDLSSAVDAAGAAVVDAESVYGALVFSGAGDGAERFLVSLPLSGTGDGAASAAA